MHHIFKICGLSKHDYVLLRSIKITLKYASGFLIVNHSFIVVLNGIWSAFWNKPSRKKIDNLKEDWTNLSEKVAWMKTILSVNKIIYIIFVWFLLDSKWHDESWINLRNLWTISKNKNSVCQTTKMSILKLEFKF